MWPVMGMSNLLKQKIGIIVMEIRDPFFFTLFCSHLPISCPAAAKGYKPQICGILRDESCLGGMHGHIVNACYMSPAC